MWLLLQRWLLSFSCRVGVFVGYGVGCWAAGALLPQQQHSSSWVQAGSRRCWQQHAPVCSAVCSALTAVLCIECCVHGILYVAALLCSCVCTLCRLSKALSST
jgi:hypothetical protein